MYLNRWLRKPSVSKRHLKQEAGGREWASFAKSKRKSHPGRGNSKCQNPGMQKGLASSRNWASSRSGGLLKGKRLNLTHVLRIRISSSWYHRVGGEPDTIYSKFLSKRVLLSKIWSCLLYDGRYISGSIWLCLKGFYPLDGRLTSVPEWTWEECYLWHVFLHHMKWGPVRIEQNAVFLRRKLLLEVQIPIQVTILDNLLKVGKKIEGGNWQRN